MTQDRRIDDRRPDQPLQWDDTETLAGQSWNAPAAPAAGPAELAKLQRYDHLGCLMAPDASGDYYAVADVEALFTRLSQPSAPVTAEPVAWMVRRTSDGHVFGTYPSEADAVTVRGWSEDCKVVPLYAVPVATHPAPADRDAIRDQAQQWISVDERLPEYGADVLIAGTDEERGVPYRMATIYVEEVFVDHRGYPTHWMPLPSQPSASHATKGEGE